MVTETGRCGVLHNMVAAWDENEDEDGKALCPGLVFNGAGVDGARS